MYLLVCQHGGNWKLYPEQICGHGDQTTADWGTKVFSIIDSWKAGGKGLFPWDTETAATQTSDEGSF